jgi:CRISPR-associated protein Csm4
MKLYKLKLKSSIHLGQREGVLEETDTIVHSDTFFSAFCINYSLLYGERELEGLINEFRNGNPPFIFSSLFPFWNEKIYLPIPLNQIPKEKDLKKLKFIEKEGFEKLLNGEKIENLKEKYKFIPDIDEKSEEKEPWEIINNPRVGLSRISSHPGEAYFHFGEVFYKENAGLYFIVDFKDQSIESKFISTLRLMGDEGIGGDRTVGKGHFEILNKDGEKIEINQPQNSQNYILLSLYHPDVNEISDLKEGYYEIIERKGYIYSPYSKTLRKKSLKMFKEGSVFPSFKKGNIIDITPEIFTKHKIYKYGLAFLVRGIKNED